MRSEYRSVDGAWIHERARIAEDVVVEPGALIGADVEIGPECWIGCGAVIYGPTRIGAKNQIYPSVVLGGAPQDIGYAGEPTRLEIGERNVFREGVTAHRASTKDDGVTRIGSDNFLMAYTHVGHDAIVEDHIITANGCLIAGHCHVQSHANFSGGTAVMQYVTVGRYAFLGAMSGSRTDLEPFLCHDMQKSVASAPQSVNVVGLRRAGFAAEVIQNLRTAYKVLYVKDGKARLEEARAEIERRGAMCAEVDELLRFVAAKRESRLGRQRG